MLGWVKNKRPVLVGAGPVTDRVVVVALQGITGQRVGRLGETVQGIVGIIVQSVSRGLGLEIAHLVVGITKRIDRGRAELMDQRQQLARWVDQRLRTKTSAGGPYKPSVYYRPLSIYSLINPAPADSKHMVSTGSIATRNRRQTHGESSGLKRAVFAVKLEVARAVKIRWV